MFIPKEHRPHVFALLVAGADSGVPVSKGSLELDEDGWTYTAKDSDGDGLMIDVGKVYGCLFDASDTD